MGLRDVTRAIIAQVEQASGCPVLVTEDSSIATLAAVRNAYPQLTHEDILAAIAYGAEAARERIIPVLTEPRREAQT